MSARPKTKTNRPADGPINLGAAAKSIRTQLGLSQRAAASELGISFVHLCRIEKQKVSPSPEVIDRFRSTWGLDLYMVAVCFYSDPKKFAPRLRKPMARLKDAWLDQIEEVVAARRSTQG